MVRSEAASATRTSILAAASDVLIADPPAASPSPSASVAAEPSATAPPTPSVVVREPMPRPEPLVYVRQGGVTERWLRMRGRMGVDRPPDDVMRRPPRRLTDRVIDAEMWLGIFWVGLVMAIVTLVALDLRLPGGLLGGSGDENAAIGQIVGPGFSSETVVEAVETIVETYMGLRTGETETFLDAFRRVGIGPFKEALYERSAGSDI